MPAPVEPDTSASKEPRVTFSNEQRTVKLAQENEQRQALITPEKSKCDFCTDNKKPKVRPIRFNFERRETTPCGSESDTDDLDPENDGLPDPTIGRPP